MHLRFARTLSAQDGDRLLAGLLLLTRFNKPGVAQVLTVPAGERLVLDDLGVHDHLDEHIKEGDNLELLKLIGLMLDSRVVMGQISRNSLFLQACPEGRV